MRKSEDYLFAIFLKNFTARWKIAIELYKAIGVLKLCSDKKYPGLRKLLHDELPLLKIREAKIIDPSEDDAVIIDKEDNTDDTADPSEHDENHIDEQEMSEELLDEDEEESDEDNEFTGETMGDVSLEDMLVNMKAKESRAKGFAGLDGVYVGTIHDPVQDSVKRVFYEDGDFVFYRAEELQNVEAENIKFNEIPENHSLYGLFTDVVGEQAGREVYQEDGKNRLFVKFTMNSLTDQKVVHGAAYLTKDHLIDGKVAKFPKYMKE